MTKITLIGSGNVGYHMANRFKEKGLDVVEVFSRKKAKAAKLAKRIGCSFQTDLRKINCQSDLYIIAVNDDVIGSVAEQLSKNDGMKNKLVVHTSGATLSLVLKPHFENFGIFYALQSFSISKPVDFDNIPICIYSSRKKNRTKLFKLAETISPKVYLVNDEQRAILHVAAVFANNFTNHIYHIAHQLCEKEQVDFDILKPLILETALKVQNNLPKDMRTGPGVRKDQETIDKHLVFLQKYPEWELIYRLMTKGIQG